ncbi:RNA polymerase sigma factor [Planctomycetota bacterium]
MAFEKTSDEALMRAVSLGDRNAFADLFCRHYSKLVRFLYYRVRDADTAMDLAQDIFYHVYRQAGQYHTGRSFSSWLYGIARNKCIDHTRSQYRHQAAKQDAVVKIQNAIEKSTLDPLMKLIHQEFQLDIDSWLESLEEPVKSALEMRLGGKDFKAISAAMNLPVTTLRNHISKALKQLRKA